MPFVCVTFTDSRVNFCDKSLPAIIVVSAVELSTVLLAAMFLVHSKMCSLYKEYTACVGHQLSRGYHLVYLGDQLRRIPLTM